MSIQHHLFLGIHIKSQELICSLPFHFLEKKVRVYLNACTYYLDAEIKQSMRNFCIMIGNDTG